jgi:RimJ/RimL family protein N-acetyltransferase
MSRPYEFRVEGHLDDRWAAVLDGFRLRHEVDGTTTVTGVVVDQAHLHGLLARLRDLGVSLLSMQAVAPAGSLPPTDVASAALLWPRRTDRLVLRPPTVDDAQATWRIRRLESVRRWLPEAPTSLAPHRCKSEQPTRLATTVVVLLDGQIIGDLTLRVEDAWGQNEVAHLARQKQARVAWLFDPHFAGQGYATEAARELIKVCFHELALRRVVASCFADDTASWRLMERIGMRREAHAIEDALLRTGQWADTFTYAASSSTWSPQSGQATP